MDEFGYLSVLLSIIIGLAVTQLLTGVRGLMLHRARIRRYWVPVAWGGISLVVLTQTWWAMFGLRTRTAWTFAEFAVVLLHTVLLYLLTGLVFPDFGDAPVDLRAHYFAHRGWFFTLLLVVTLASLSKDLVLTGHLPDPTNVAFHGAYAAIGLVALATARPRVHELLAALTAVLFALYIALLFTRLH
jgi:hypothetical protein